MSTPGALISYEGFNNVRYATMLSGNGVKTLRCSYNELYEPLTVRSHQKRRGDMTPYKVNVEMRIGQNFCLKNPRQGLTCGAAWKPCQLKRFCWSAFVARHFRWSWNIWTLPWHSRDDSQSAITPWVTQRNSQSAFNRPGQPFPALHSELQHWGESDVCPFVTPGAL